MKPEKHAEVILIRPRREELQRNRNRMREEDMAHTFNPSRDRDKDGVARRGYSSQSGLILALLCRYLYLGR
jgi:hypothetical protein